MKRFMKSIPFKIYRHLQSKIGSQLILGFIINFMLLFSFSLNSYFRPYYEHENSNLNPNTVTFIKSFYEETDTEEYFQENASVLIKDVKKTYFSTLKYMPNSSISVFFVNEDFNLNELGYFPNNFQASDKNALFITYSNKSISYIKEYLPFLQDFDIEVNRKGFYMDSKNPFDPIIYEDSLLILNEKYMDYVNSDRYSVYCTIISDSYISDSQLSKITKMSTNTGFIKPAFDRFLHPAKDYMRYYGLINPLIESLLFLDILLGVMFFLTFSFSRYLWLLKNKEELQFYLLFGMKEQKLRQILTFSGSMIFIFTSLVSYLCYLLFMWIYSLIKGYTFFFHPCFLILYFGLIFLDLSIQYLFSYITLKKIEKEKAILEE